MCVGCLGHLPVDTRPDRMTSSWSANVWPDLLNGEKRQVYRCHEWESLCDVSPCMINIRFWGAHYQSERNPICVISYADYRSTRLK
jgi:hypothetical protein